MRIGFVGLGNMGAPMCANLVKAGHAVKAYDLVPALVQAAAGKGAAPATSVGDCADAVEVVITMLPSSPHVRLAYGGESGILEHARPGTLLIDCSTIDPLTARDVAFDARAKGLGRLDAPVSGGTAGAIAGTLTFMVGGEVRDFEAARGILAGMGLHLGMDVPNWPPEYIEELAKKFEDQM